ncbi:MAG: molybdate ABC transporter substrate-binding protein [Candidatus Parcubacteria bacterium]|nr:molybdate ABC transporter substrate-binding protein [Burkholderiales bacterium]
MRIKAIARSLPLALAIALAAAPAAADEAQLAVAANFAGPVKQLADRFTQTTQHKLSISVGSTGKFYAQVKNGAPFDVFLSADDETPLRMEKEKLAVAGTRFTYAIGKLVLWSPSPGVVNGKGEVLRKTEFKRLAIANPKLAPYGAAAQQTLEKLGVWQAVQGKLVMGENIAQTLQFVATGNAELGFVALSQIQEGGKPPAGSHWLVPQSLYDPIRQDAVLLARGGSNPAARLFLDFLRSAPARELVRSSGYDLP